MSHYLSESNRIAIEPIIPLLNDTLSRGVLTLELPTSDPKRLAYLIRNAVNSDPFKNNLAGKFRIYTKEKKVVCVNLTGNLILNSVSINNQNVDGLKIEIYENPIDQLGIVQYLIEHVPKAIKFSLVTLSDSNPEKDIKRLEKFASNSSYSLEYNSDLTEFTFTKN